MTRWSRARGSRGSCGGGLDEARHLVQVHNVPRVARGGSRFLPEVRPAAQGVRREGRMADLNCSLLAVRALGVLPLQALSPLLIRRIFPPRFQALQPRGLPLFRAENREALGDLTATPKGHRRIIASGARRSHSVSASI